MTLSGAAAVALVCGLGAPTAEAQVPAISSASLGPATGSGLPTSAATTLSPLSLARRLQPKAPSSARYPGTKCRLFPATSWWHADISRLPVNSHSAQWLSVANAGSTLLHPDFGPNFDDPSNPYGIPITVVRQKHPSKKLSFEYSDESDHVGYPLNAKTRIEGGWNAPGDRHALVINAKTCRLYEVYHTRLTSDGWTAGSGATWSLKNNALRPNDWTSADEAGLAITPGLLRWDEVADDHIDHAIRFTLDGTGGYHIWPARHPRNFSDANPNTPPLGSRFRLNASFDVSSYSPYARRILIAMKSYGLALADTGSDWYFCGTSDTRWPNSLLDELKTVPASAFQAVDTGPLRITNNSARSRR